MSKKNMEVTPKSRVKNAIRQLWLRSRERSQAIRNAHNTCAACHRKGSVAKGREVSICAHHAHGIDWDGVVDLIIKRVLQTPADYTIMCKECHDAHHAAHPSHSDSPTPKQTTLAAPAAPLPPLPPPQNAHNTRPMPF